MCIAGPATNRRRGPGKDHRAAPQWDQPTSRLPTGEESAEAADAPERLEHVRGDLAKVDPSVVAGIVDDEVGGSIPVPWCHGPVEQTDHRAFVRYIRRHA